MKRHKFFIVTTVASSMGFFRGNLRVINKDFNVLAIAANKDQLEAFGKKEGVDTYHIPMQRQISLWSDFICLCQFIWLFIKKRPTIVHGNTPKGAFLSMFAAWLTARPIRIYMCHGLRYQTAKGFKRKLLKFMERITLACATDVISVSFGVMNTLVFDGLCKKSKIKVLGHGSVRGVELKWFSPEAVTPKINTRKEMGIASDAFVFIFVGRLTHDKGIDELVEAFVLLKQEVSKDVHLVLIGQQEPILDPLQLKTIQLIQNVEEIHAIGRKSDVRPYLMDANAFVMPSHREGFGIVQIEACAMGLPCIASDIIGCNEIIIPQKNGELVPVSNVKELFEKMKDWATHPEKVNFMGSQARETIANRYDQQKVWALQREEYLRLLGKHRIVRE